MIEKREEAEEGRGRVTAWQSGTKEKQPAHHHQQQATRLGLKQTRDEDVE